MHFQQSGNSYEICRPDPDDHLRVSEKVRDFHYRVINTFCDWSQRFYLGDQNFTLPQANDLYMRLFEAYGDDSTTFSAVFGREGAAEPHNILMQVKVCSGDDWTMEADIHMTVRASSGEEGDMHHDIGNVSVVLHLDAKDDDGLARLEEWIDRQVEVIDDHDLEIVTDAKDSTWREVLATAESQLTQPQD